MIWKIGLSNFGRAGSAGLSGLAALALCGCAAQAYDVPTTVATPGMANPERALQESMSNVGREMDRIGRIRPDEVAHDVPRVVPGELDKVVSFAWAGSLDEGVEKLAHSIGYRVSISAPPDPRPLTMAINSGPQRIYYIFKQIGDDAGGQATVRVDPLHQTVEVIHHV
jgi:defect-in-organelle-trafficking protein DotD